jgi:SAM-dependent MidA family methyltransferase
MTPLGRLIAEEIAATGPMRLDRFMALCLGHPDHGYYMTAEPFGEAGDFTTAPEISQMTGELIGLWAAQLWQEIGRPAPLRLVELGPGRGTLMADALRAARLVPGFRDAAEVWLVETSPRLRALQRAAVPAARHANTLDAVPPGPMLLIANEFFDALPIRQFHCHGGHWRERQVGLDGDRLVWGLGPAAGDLPDEAPEDAVLERCPAGEAVAAQIGTRLKAAGGAALILDYGAEPPAHGGGDTLQALRKHAPADPLAAPGQADLTAHVDFTALGAALRAGGAAVAPLLTQGDFLGRLGIAARAEALARAHPDRAADVAAQRHRLTAPDQMGTLFKALAATGPGQPAPPAFEAPR